MSVERVAPVGGHDHLHHVTEPGDAKPDKGAAPGEEPPVLRVHKGEKRRAEAHEHLEAVAHKAVEICWPQRSAAALFAGFAQQAVAAGKAQAAKVEHVALGADAKVHAGGLPDRLAFHTQMAAAGQMAQQAQGLYQ